MSEQVLTPSELPFRTNRLDALARFVKEDVRNWFALSDKKPLWRQVREAAALWRAYGFVPYHYLKHDLFLREVGDNYRDYAPSLLADRFVYVVNPKQCIDWLEDKLEYDRRMRAIGLPFVPTLAVVSAEGDALRAVDPDGAALSMAEVLAISRRDAPAGVFLKPRYGQGGKGAFRMHVAGEGFMREGRVLSEADIAARMRGSGFSHFMLQPFFEQHPAMARVHPASVNTLRILTFRSGEDVEITASYLRIGGGGNETDNGSGGGYAAHADLRTGKVGARAIIHLSFAATRSAERHPVTGVAFADLTIPHAAAIVDFVTQGARAFAPLRVIGWDIAVGPDGPCAIEANSIPGFRPVQDVCGGLRRTAYGEEMAAHFGWR